MTDSGLHFRAAPALHPRLLAAPLPQPGGGCWSVPSLLDPGLAAEAIEALRLLPTVPHYAQSPGEVGLYWRCDATLPAAISPQLPEAMFRLQRAVDEDIPALISAALAQRLAPARPGVISLWQLRKGSWHHDTPPADGPVRYLIELTGAQWPASWGGHLELGGAPPRPVAWDQLTVLPPGCSLRLPVLRRHVSALFIVGELVATR